MKHKLIMENWRKYLLNEVPMQDAGPGAFTPKIPITKQEVQNLVTLNTLLDPTSIVQDYNIESGEVTTIIDVLQKDKDNLQKAIETKDYGAAALHAGAGILGILSMIPFVGKGFKAARLARLQKHTKQLEKQLDRVPGDKAKEISAKVKEFNQEAERLLKKTKGTEITATSKTLSKLGEALPVKKVDISKLDNSVDRVKSLAAAAKTLFKGRVKKDEIILFRGIAGKSFNIPGGSKQDLIDMFSLFRKGWTIPGANDMGAHEAISMALSGAKPQFFAAGAEDAAKYAVQNAFRAGQESRNGAVIAIRVPKWMMGQFANFISGFSTGGGDNFEIPVEMMKALKDSGDIGAIFF